VWVERWTPAFRRGDKWWRKPVSLFFAVLPRIYSERSLVCRRDPGSAPLQRAEETTKHSPSDRPTAARDDDGFAALNLVEDLQQMRLRFRGLNISLEWSG